MQQAEKDKGAQTAEGLSNIPHAKVWRLLTAQERRRVIILLMLTLFGVGLEMLGIGMVVPMVAVLTQDDIGAAFPAVQPALDFLGNPERSELVIGGMTLLVLVYFAKSAYLSVFTWLKMRTIFSIRVRISEQLYNTYLHQPWTFHMGRNSSKLIRNVLTETHQLLQSVLLPLIDLVAESLLLVAVIALLLVFEPVGALSAAAVGGLVGALFYFGVRNRVNVWGKERQHHEALTIQHLQQGLTGVKDVKLHGREEDFLNVYKSHFRHAIRRIRQQAVLSAMPRMWLEFLAVSSLAVLVSAIILQGRSTESVLATVGLFGAVAVRLLPSVNRVISAMQELRFGTAVADNVEAELSLPMEETQAADEAEEIRFGEALRCEDLCYQYPESQDLVLSNINIEVRKGESVGFVGQSGSGKSTLIDLILGVLRAKSGHITVDGANMLTGLRSWQSKLGYVPQTIYLTDDSLRANIAFGMPQEEIDDEKVMRAVESSRLGEFVEGLPEGLNTIVGEQGTRLSGGQRQRIGIARALYHDPEVLILDEATSALDNETEREVMRTVNELHGAKTILIVAHRLSTVETCDRIYRLDAGHVVDQGPPSSVLHNVQDLRAVGSD